MNVVVVLLMVLSCAAATEVNLQPKVVRVPQHDSAIIQSHRLGGNFAYSTHEAHAYGVETPIVKQRLVPKVTYHQGEPIVKTHTSYVKQKVPQFGVVRTQHTVPAVQYAAVNPVQQQVITTQQVAAPVQYVQYSGASAGPVQYVQYSGVPVSNHGVFPLQYAVSPVQYVTGNFQSVATKPKETS